MQRRRTRSSSLPRFSSWKKSNTFQSLAKPAYEILKCSNTVNYKIKELTTGKFQVVHYYRLKRYHGPIPVASIVQTRPTTHSTGYQTPPVPDFDRSQCVQTFSPFTFAPQMTWPHLVNHPTSPISSLTPIADNFPNHLPSAAPLPLLSSARRCILLSTARSIEQERRLLTLPDGRKSSSFSSQGATFVQSPSRLDFLIDGASHNLRQRLYSSPQSNSPATLCTSLNTSHDIHAPPSTNTSTTSRSLRSNTKQQRKAQPLFRAKLPRDLTECLSPKKKTRSNRRL